LGPRKSKPEAKILVVLESFGQLMKIQGFMMSSDISCWKWRRNYTPIGGVFMAP